MLNGKMKLIPILIIDDEPSVLLFLRLCLSRRGYQVDTAASLGEGIEKLRAYRYSVVLTDISLDLFTADQILSELRKASSDAVSVIGMSGSPWLLVNTEFDAVLNKPCSIEDIYSVLRQAYKGNSLESFNDQSPARAVPLHLELQPSGERHE